MGRSAAEVFAAEGARVAVLARTATDLDDTTAALMAQGASEAVGVRTDFRDEAQVAKAFVEIRRRWGHLNVLVNCAGPSQGIGGIEAVDDIGWHGALDSGLLSAVRCIRHALPLLRAGAWARIVNVSAHSTKRQTPGLIAYTAAKAAMTSMSKNLSQTLAPEGILVNTVSPGSFVSEGLKGYLRSLPPERGIDPDDLHDAMRAITEDFGHPAYMGRAGDPREIGPVIAFLGSRINSYMTGADVNVDGGSDFT
jgi:3-oxoacyl-[acyl-carrier protein] reductase